MDNINFSYADARLAELEKFTYDAWKDCDIPGLQDSLEKAHLAVIEAREELLILKNQRVNI